MTCCQGNTIVCTTINKPAINLNQGQLEHKFFLEKIQDRIQSLRRRQMRLNCNVIITIRVVAFRISEMKCNLSARRWVVAHMCVLSHLRTCDVCRSAYGMHYEMCVRRACVQLVYRRAICDRTSAPFFKQNDKF